MAGNAGKVFRAIRPRDLMRELGYPCAASEATLRELFLLLDGPLTEESVAEIIGMIAATHSGLEDGFRLQIAGDIGGEDDQGEKGDMPPKERDALKSWAWMNVVDTIQNMFPALDWIKIARALDYPGFVVPDLLGLGLLSSIFQRALHNEPFPVDSVIARVWNNTAGQLSWLQLAVTAPPGVFSFARSPRRQQPVDGIHPPGSSKAFPANESWLSIDLIETLLLLSAKGHSQAVARIFEVPVKQYPELLLFGIALSNQQLLLQLPLAQEIVSTVFQNFLNHPNHQIIFHHLWQLSPQTLIMAMASVHSHDGTLLPRLLDLAQELKALNPILESSFYNLAIDLAVLATRREYLNIEKWVNEKVNQDGIQFLASLINFLREKTALEIAAQQSGMASAPGKLAALGPSFEVVVTFLRCLESKIRVMPRSLVDEVRELYQSRLHMNAKIGTLVPEPVAEPFPPDIEEETNRRFQQIYKGELSIEQAVTMLGQCMNSPSQREQDIYACMIENLFHEYRFFHKYPEKELRITGVLFGSLIARHLLNSFRLKTALRYVLDSLYKVGDAQSQLFRFGLYALEEFKNRLSEWPQYCMIIESIPHISEHPEVMAIISPHLQSQQNQAAGSGGVAGATPSLASLGAKQGQQAQTVAQQQAAAAAAAAAAAGGGAGGAGAGGAGKPPLPPGLMSPTRVPLNPSPHLGMLGLNPAAVAAGLVNLGGVAGLVGLNNAQLLAGAAGGAAGVGAGGVGAGVGVGSGGGPMRASPTMDMASPSPMKKKPTGPEKPSFATSINLDTLLEAQAAVGPEVEPDEATQDRIHFIFNNLSASNMDQKLIEMQSLLREEYYPYIAQYLVVKRASIEPNFHALYIAFLEALRRRLLFEIIIAQSVNNVMVLLESDKTKTSSSERTLLKNLGAWLGALTIGRNRPLLHRHVDLKGLIFDAYENDRLIAVIPFVAKILESCARSRVFRPPNPWLMAMMALLNEIYHLGDLKLNLKFEIEVLCKTLNLELNEIKATSMLQNRPQRRALVDAALVFQDSNSGVERVCLMNIQSQSQHNQAHAMEQLMGAGSSSEPPANQVLLMLQQSSGTAAGGQVNAAAATSTAAAAAAGLGYNTVPSAQGGTQLAGEQPLIPNLVSYVTANPQLMLFNAIPSTKQCVSLAVDRGIREIITIVVERSVTIACISTKEIVLKDFACDPDEMRLRKSAQLMVQGLAGSLAMVYCKEPLRMAIGNHFRSLLGAIPEVANIPRPQLEETITAVANDNLDLACTIIEKAAIDKATRDIEEALAQAFQSRRRMRETGQAYVDMQYLTNNPIVSTLPESLRIKPVVGLTPPQMRIFEDFGRASRVAQVASQLQAQALAQSQQPQSSGVASQAGSGVSGAAGLQGQVGGGVAPGSQGPQQPPAQLIPTQALLAKFQATLSEIDSTINVQLVGNLSQQLASLSPDHPLLHLLRRVPLLIAQAMNKDECFLLVALAVLSRLQDPATSGSTLHREVNLALLKAAGSDANLRMIKELSNAFLSDDNRVLSNREFLVGLIGLRLVIPSDLDLYLVRNLEAGRTAFLELALFLIQTCMVTHPYISATEFRGTIDVLVKLVGKRRGPVVDRLLEEARTVIVARDMQGKVVKRPCRGEWLVVNGLGDKSPDSEQVRDWVFRLFEDWIQFDTNDRTIQTLLQQIQQQGVFRSDESLSRFFTIMVEVCVDSYENQVEAGFKNLRADGFAKLVVILVKFINDSAGQLTKARLFQSVMDSLVDVAMRDADIRKSRFNQRCYFRILSTWLSEISFGPTEDANLQLLTLLTGALLNMQPVKLPAMAFAWLSLVSHRSFMPRLLNLKNQAGWPLMQRLLMALFRFLEPYLRPAELNDAVRLMYKGTLRVLLVLLHDFPEFLSDYHFGFCDVIPASCIQMRNLILSAYPRNMRLPDPFTQNLKVDRLPEITLPPRILSDFAVSLRSLRGDLDNFLKTRASPTFLKDLVGRLMLSNAEAAVQGTRYNIPLINSLSLYVGSQYITQMQNKSGDAHKINPAAPMDIFQHLINELDSEGRYLFLNALANQLRYPNNHTHYYSFVLLFLFSEAKRDVIREQITRVLIERLIVSRPHPWGLLITFIELIKNPRYAFWEQAFTRSAPEIQRLFESVARSCMGPQQQPGTGAQQTGAGAGQTSANGLDELQA